MVLQGHVYSSAMAPARRARVTNSRATSRHAASRIRRRATITTSLATRIRWRFVRKASRSNRFARALSTARRNVRFDATTPSRLSLSSPSRKRRTMYFPTQGRLWSNASSNTPDCAMRCERPRRCFPVILDLHRPHGAGPLLFAARAELTRRDDGDPCDDDGLSPYGHPRSTSLHGSRSCVCVSCWTAGIRVSFQFIPAGGSESKGPKEYHFPL
jgi:hypothetical protein